MKQLKLKRTTIEVYEQVFDAYDRCRSPSQVSRELQMPLGTVQKLISNGLAHLPSIKKTIDEREANVAADAERIREKNAMMRRQAVDFISTSALKNVAEQMNNVDVVPSGTRLSNGRIEVDEKTLRTLVGTAKTAYDLSEDGQAAINAQQQNVNVDVNVGVDTRATVERVQQEHEKFEQEHGSEVTDMGPDKFRKLLREEVARRKQAKGK